MSRCGCVKNCSCLVVADNTDDTCVDVVVTGQGSLTIPYKVSAHPIISSDANNKLTCRATGLFAAGVSIVGDIDNDGCVNTSVTEGPTNVFTLESTIIINPDADNVLGPNFSGSGDSGCTPTGLKLSVEDVQDAIGQEIGPNLAGTCLVYNDASNKINVEIDTDITNQVGCGTGPTGTGLYVPPAPTVVKTVQNDPTQTEVVGPLDTITFTCVPVPVTANTVPGAPCFSVTGDTCTGLNFQLGISTDPCNGLQCHGNGLFIFQDPTALPFRTSAVQAQPPQGPFNGTMGVTNIGIPMCTSITNPSACKSMAVAGDFYGDVRISKTAGTINIGLAAGTSIGGPFGPTSSIAGLGGPTQGAGDSTFNLYNNDFDFGIVAPGATVTICATFFVVTAGVVNGRILSGDINLSLRPRWND